MSFSETSSDVIVNAVVLKYCTEYATDTPEVLDAVATTSFQISRSRNLEVSEPCSSETVMTTLMLFM